MNSSPSSVTPSAAAIASARARSAIQTRMSGACRIWAWFPAIRASASRFSGSLTATTLQACTFDEVGAEEAAATRVSSVPSGSGSGR